MLCPVCKRYMKTGTTNKHHFWFPRKKYQGQPKWKRDVMPVHVSCHNDFNWFMSNVCRTRLECFSCKYDCICCYYPKGGG